MCRLMETAKILAHQRVASGKNQQHKNQGPNRFLGQPSHGGGAGIRKEKGTDCRWQDGSPGHFDLTRVAPAGIGRTDHAGALVRAKQACRAFCRVNRKQGGDLDQPTTTDDGIDGPGKKCCEK